LNCKICQYSDLQGVYYGKIRGGDGPQTVLECKECHTQFLKHDKEVFNYRETVGPDEFTRHFQGISSFCNVDTAIKGKVVLDVGASDGQFLKVVGGYATTRIAVETDKNQHSLIQAEHIYDSLDDCLVDWAGKVETITCWHVIEHVTDPVEFMLKLRELLCEDGVLYISTPNREELLMTLLWQEYAPFFYRLWHPYYYNEDSLRYALMVAGFHEQVFDYYHSFGLGNLLGWLRDKKPSGTGIVLNRWQHEAIDQTWQGFIESSQHADTLYVCAYKGVMQ